MWSAAEGRSALGIPASVGKEFVGKDGLPRAAGAVIEAKDGKALFLKRKAGDHAGTWAFPGGMAEGDESPEAAAIRELTEEIQHEFALQPYHHFLGDELEFVTHHAAVDAQFVPTMNEEHSAFAWAPLDDPPQPLHPGVAKMLADRKARDEAFSEAYDARLKCGADAAMAMDYADRVVSLLYTRGPASRTGIAFDRESVRQMDPDGRLHVIKANISKAAINPYLGREIPDYEKLGLDPDRVYKLLRHPDELKKAAKSFNNIPLLSEHLAVSAENHEPDAVVGALGSDAKYEHPFLTNSLVVWAKHGIDGIESEQQREISAAYRYTCDMTAGEYEGEPFDGIMRDLSGNHCALVERGRAGPDVVVGDSNIPTEIMIMAKDKLSRAGVLLHGAIAAAILPKLAKDAAIDLGPVLAKITAKNFKAEKANIFAGVKKACDGKLAKDANIEDVTKLLDSLEKAGVDELDPNAAPGPMGGETDDDDDAAMDETEAAKAFLASKLSPEDMAEYQRMCAEGAGDADLSEEEKKQRDADMAKKAEDEKRAKDEADAKAAAEKDKPPMVDKKAMDAAIEDAKRGTEKSVMDRMQAINDAREAVEPYVGKIKVNVAMDSAEKVYATALVMLGMDGVDDLPLKALQKLLSSQPKPGHGQRDTTIAQDAESATGFHGRFPNAGRIAIAR